MEKFDEIEKKFNLANLHVVEIVEYGFPLINFLSPIRKIFYYFLNKKVKRIDKECRTKLSGTKSKLKSNLPVIRWFNGLFFDFFDFLQFILNNSGRGDGVVIVAKKNDV